MASLGHLNADPLVQDGRYARRRQLKLHVRASAGAQPSNVVIHNISPTGLLIQTDDELRTGDTLEVELPETGVVQAQVVWDNDGFYGCEFASPLKQATVSAAILVSPPVQEAHTVVNPGAPKRLSAFARVAIVGTLAAASWGMVGGLIALVAY